MTLSQPDVTLTDYGLALLSGGFAWHLAQLAPVPARTRLAWIVFFGSVAVGAASGGTVHGFFLDETSAGYRILWPLTMLAVGVTAAAVWVLAGSLITRQGPLRHWYVLAGVTFAVYALVVLLYAQGFVVVLLNELPPMVAFTAAAMFRFARERQGHLRFLIAGLLISFAAAFVQHDQVAISAAHFNNNATFHLVQAIGLCFIWFGARGPDHA